MTNYAFQSLFDFTRTTSGTFVGSNGLIQTTPASVNLLLQTQEFDNAAWTKSNSTVTANATVAPDGTSTADKLVEAATTSSHYVLRAATVTTAAHVFSVYAKAGERSFVSLAFDGLQAWFNLATGAVGTIEAGLTAAIVSVGDGWYRCSVIRTVTVAGSKSSVIYSATADNAVSYTGNGTSGIFIWGAQLEQAATATTYTRNNGGVYPARFDYDPATLAPKGILIEEQRVNLVLQSETFDNASWSKSGSTVTANATTSPDGTANADKLAENATSGTHWVLQSVTTTAVAHTATAFMKASERTWGLMRLRDSTGTDRFAWFNLATGAVGTVQTNLTASITSFGNGWYRCSITISAALAGSCPYVIGPSTADNVVTYVGTDGSGIFLWGAQLEAGAFATSYIPTVASQVTRTADQCSIVAPLFAPWYNQSEGTIVASILSAPVNTSAQQALYLSDGTASNSIFTRRAVGGSVATAVTTGGVVQGDVSAGSAVAGSAAYKYAFAYAANDLAESVNGSAVGTDTSATIPTLSQMNLGASVANIQLLNGHIRSIRYYPVRLADFQLQALTA